MGRKRDGPRTEVVVKSKSCEKFIYRVYRVVSIRTYASISTCMQFFLVFVANGLYSFKLQTSVILVYQTHCRGYNGINKPMFFIESISELLE